MAVAKYFYHNGKNSVGPFNMTQVRKMLLHGIIRPGAKICRDGSDTWAVPEAFAEFHDWLIDEAQKSHGHGDEFSSYDPLLDPNAPWRREPASDRQKNKLKFFGISFKSRITKGQAAELLDAINDPKREREYEKWKAVGEPKPSRSGCIGPLVLISVAGIYFSIHPRVKSPPDTATPPVVETPLPSIVSQAPTAPPLPHPTAAPVAATVSPTDEFLSKVDAQRDAVRKYPELAVKGSPMNARFVSRYQFYQRENPDFFKDNAWPMHLADEVAPGK